MEPFTLSAPGDIDTALAAASNADTKLIAGGTDLIQLMQDWVEISDRGARIGALARMSDVADHPELRRLDPVMVEALLASASPQVRNMATIGGNLQQRTRCGYFRDVGFRCNKRLPGSGCPAINGENRLLAILGGSDHCVATHASDLAVALAALDAAVELRGASQTGNSATRWVPLTEFHLLPGDTPERETSMAPGEMITAVLVPPAPPGSARFI
jgi:xanthine dehydrogenase YagS FAD-binding subunit